jgi:hypothetical protein
MACGTLDSCPVLTAIDSTFLGRVQQFGWVFGSAGFTIQLSTESHFTAINLTDIGSEVLFASRLGHGVCHLSVTLYSSTATVRVRLLPSSPVLLHPPIPERRLLWSDQWPVIAVGSCFSKHKMAHLQQL